MITSIDKASSVPVCTQIEQAIERQLRETSPAPGSAMESEHALAERLSVNRLTVRRAYKRLEERGLIEKVQGKGTFFKGLPLGRNSRRQSTRTIGVVFPEIVDFFPAILHAIEKEADDAGYGITLKINESGKRERSAFSQLMETGVDGIIFTPFRGAARNSPAVVSSMLRDCSVPVVMIGRPPMDIQCDAVYCNDVVASRKGCAYLAEQGYSRLIHVSNSQGDSEAIAERMEGYRYVVGHDLGIDELILDIQNPDWQKELELKVRTSQERTGIFCAEDEIAAMVLNSLLSSGTDIPGMVGILGVDDDPICTGLPIPLSTIAHPKTLLGKRAFSLLDGRMKDPRTEPEESSHVIFIPEIIARSST
jgi:GntR family transcriptional regulator of arabinose operon